MADSAGFAFEISDSIGFAFEVAVSQCFGIAFCHGFGVALGFSNGFLLWTDTASDSYRFAVSGSHCQSIRRGAHPTRNCY
jgi:hypothetical protein